jgi:glycosyltransferase involved in cell wall biosynthesis
MYKLMPGYRSTRRYSAAIIVGSRHTYEEMPPWAKEKCVIIPENGVDPDRFRIPRTRSASLPLRGAFVGRLVPYKGADMLFEAAAAFLQEGKLVLHIIGDGPQRAELEMMAQRLGVGDMVRFHGWVPHVDVHAILRECDFMALPSVREFGGGVVIEAMALGVTPIVADYAGPSELVDDKTGIRVSFRDRQSLIEGLRRTIAEVIRTPRVLDELGSAGHEKVYRKLTWESKAAQIVAIYNAVLAQAEKLNSLKLSS